jgi:hypothetical protein
MGAQAGLNLIASAKEKLSQQTAAWPFLEINCVKSALSATQTMVLRFSEQVAVTACAFSSFH